VKTIATPASETAFGVLTGGTPMTPLYSISRRTGHRILGKCEFLNPGGSLKDRIALSMIEAAEAAGHLQRGKSVIVEASGGNTGLALAALSAVRGYRVVITLSSKVGPEKINLLRAWGADVVMCPSEVSPDSEDHFLATARRIACDRPNHLFLDQFSNCANVRAHYSATAPEIWHQAGPTVDAVVCGAGTGGTIMGLARYARERDSATRFVLADPAGSILAAVTRGEKQVARAYSVEGIGGDFVPPLFDPTIVTTALTVEDEAAFAACRALLREEGLFVGLSSGCSLVAAERYAATLLPLGQTIVVILADSGRNYMSKLAPASAQPRGALSSHTDQLG
jgi:cystathionine beta-synthase